MSKVPYHVAIVMDGNGRWATKRFLPRIAGHRQGVESLRRCVEACVERGVGVLTVFAFSSENWNRPSEEVSGLMELLALTLSGEVPRLHANGVRIHFVGDRVRLSQKVQAGLAQAEHTTAGNQRLVLNVCFNYGGRWDIAQAAQKLASRGEAITELSLDRAMALAEQTRDLSSLLDRLEDDGSLRQQLAALPGPILPPSRPGDLLQVIDVPPPLLVANAPRLPWIMPVSGRLVSGFGAQSPTGLTTGVTLAPAAGAQVVSPADGRVAFAGPYRGYGTIVIVEHAGGWTTLVTNLGRIAATVGEKVVQGSPLGTAGPGRPVLSVELRRDGAPVNPLEQQGG
ncbi:MAG: di-trans,poly-cis-decaprenylcistransferase [Novosphingobium sp. 16-62-11]|nr:MAG: di-trans,poly-cis-decaprenylcistransferase [Novosphingobium sp. 16-62-11]